MSDTTIVFDQLVDFNQLLKIFEEKIPQDQQINASMFIESAKRFVEAHSEKLGYDKKFVELKDPHSLSESQKKEKEMSTTEKKKQIKRKEAVDNFFGVKVNVADLLADLKGSMLEIISYNIHFDYFKLDAMLNKHKKDEKVCLFDRTLMCFF